MKRALLIFLLAIAARAATISTITCTSGVATVTVANALIASQGFEITGSSVSTYNINGTAVSATSTSFTFNVTCNGSATGGTFNPAQQILVLSLKVNGGVLTATEIFWNTTITPQPCPGCTSTWPTATAAQIAAIQTGTTIESQQFFNVPITTSTTALNTLVTTQYNTIQSAYAGNLLQYIGFCYNGSTWSATCT